MEPTDQTNGDSGQTSTDSQQDTSNSSQQDLSSQQGQDTSSNAGINQQDNGANLEGSDDGQVGANEGEASTLNEALDMIYAAQGKPKPASKTDKTDKTASSAQPNPDPNKQAAQQQAQQAQKQNFQPGQNTQRKFDGLDQREARWFRQMSNEAYNHLYPRFVQARQQATELETLRKENAQIKNAHFYEQEGAWTLNPEYKELEQTVSFTEAQINHWQEQLVNIKAGNKWKPLVFDAQGNTVVGAERDPSPQNEVLIMGALSKAQGLHHNASNQLMQYGEKFKGEHAGYVDMLKGARAKILAGADIPKLEAASKPMLKLFPPHMQGRIEAQLIAELLTIQKGLIAKLQAQQGNQQSQQIRQATARNAGPTNGALQVTGATNNIATDSKSALDLIRKARG